MKNILLTIEYDGTNFHGWQIQPDVRTVQGELESVLSAVCHSEIRLAGLSRTDAGVHAYGQRASFCGDFSIPADRLMLAANDRLGAGRLSAAARPGDVRITAAAEVPERFHARHDAAGKKYIYRMLTAERPDVFLRDKYWQIAERPDMDAMAAAAKHLIGRHDFNAFRAAGGKEPETTVRTVFGLAVYAERDGAGRQISTLEITGDGFLYNMVRIIAGTLFQAGTGKRTPESVGAAIASKDRGHAGPTAPPQGLYLAEAYYDEEEMQAAAGRRYDAVFSRSTTMLKTY